MSRKPEQRVIVMLPRELRNRVRKHAKRKGVSESELVRAYVEGRVNQVEASIKRRSIA